MDKISKIIIATLFALSFSFSDDQSIKDQFISDLLEKMTLEEKIGQMTQVDRQFIELSDINEYFILRERVGNVETVGDHVSRFNRTSWPWLIAILRC